MASDHTIQPRPLIATDDVELLDDLLRLAAAAQVEPDIAISIAATRARWSSAPMVIVGVDVAQALAEAEVPRRQSVILVNGGNDDPTVWKLAIAVGAEAVVALPDGEAELIDRFADMADADAVPGSVLCVVGARGGAGASLFAAALATTAQTAGLRTCAVDLDPLGPGIGLILGADSTDGLHWSDVGRTRGRVPSGALACGLPEINGITVLGWDRATNEQPWPGSVGAAIDALRRAADLVVVDLPRGPSELTAEVISRARVVLLVVPRDLRAVAAAARLTRLPMFDGADVRLVVRGPAPGGLSVDDVQAAVGVPVAVSMAACSAIDRDLEAGIAPAANGRGQLARASRAILSELAIDSPRNRGAA